MDPAVPAPNPSDLKTMTQDPSLPRQFELEDADPSRLQGLRVAVLGYGNQGHAHALNLRDSGVDVVVGLRPESRNADAARAAGFEVLGFTEAAATADIVMMLVPDELQAQIWRDQIQPNLKPGAYLAFGHGFAIAFGLIELPSDQRCFLVAPKGQGHKLREAFVAGGGLPGLIGIEGPDSKDTFELALAYAGACGALAGGGFRSSFREEAVTDLFGEQVVLCGGLVELITAAWETLVARGYSAEGAYFECLHEVKIIADLIHAKGIDGMREGISTTAAYGGLRVGSRVIGEASRKAMEDTLDAIEDGRFARVFLEERSAGAPKMNEAIQNERSHPMQETGRQLRGFLDRCKLEGPSPED